MMRSWQSCCQEIHPLIKHIVLQLHFISFFWIYWIILAQRLECRGTWQEKSPLQRRMPCCCFANMQLWEGMYMKAMRSFYDVLGKPICFMLGDAVLWVSLRATAGCKGLQKTCYCLGQSNECLLQNTRRLSCPPVATSLVIGKADEHFLAWHTEWEMVCLHPSVLLYHRSSGSRAYSVLLGLPGIPVSAECKDLLSKVLVGKPSRRYTIQQIQQHPWYLKDLPPGVTQMNNECLKLRNHSSGNQTDAEIQSIVMQAIGNTYRQEADEDLCEDVMVSCSIIPMLTVAEH